MAKRPIIEGERGTSATGSNTCTFKSPPTQPTTKQPIIIFEKTEKGNSSSGAAGQGRRSFPMVFVLVFIAGLSFIIKIRRNQEDIIL